MHLYRISGRAIRIIIFIAVSMLIFCSCAKQQTIGTSVVSQDTGMRRIVDMAGRAVNVPDKIDKVYSLSPTGTIFLYTLDPDKMIGWNYKLTAKEHPFILPKYKQLHVLGGWGGQGNSGNVEEVLTSSPDVILSLSFGKINEADKEMADELGKKTNIPVIVVDGSLERADQAYEFAGQILHQEKRADDLAQYCRETLTAIKQRKEMIVQKKRVYYAEGINGLETDPDGSFHVEVLDSVGGSNVVGTDVSIKGNYGRVAVSLEQVLIWNPEIIIVGFSAQDIGYANLKADEKWLNVDAIRYNQVYCIPKGPFDWFDRPPSVNRLIGMRWLGNLLYPDIFDFDMKKEVKRFYTLFYHYDLTDQEAEKLLNVKQ